MGRNPPSAFRSPGKNCSLVFRTGASVEELEAGLMDELTGTGVLDDVDEN